MPPKFLDGNFQYEAAAVALSKRYTIGDGQVFDVNDIESSIMNNNLT